MRKSHLKLTRLTKALPYDFFINHKGIKRMLIMETITRIRRLHYVDGKGIRTISRILRLSRNTVRKVLCNVKTESYYHPREYKPYPEIERESCRERVCHDV